MATSGSASSRRTPARGRTSGTRASASEKASLVPTKYHSWIFIGLILLSLLVFFGDVIFGNKLFVSNDFLSWESFRPYLNQMDEKGQSPLWIPYIFGGMPAFASYLVTGDRWWDLAMKGIYSIEHIFGFGNYPVMRVVLHYFIYGLGMYLLMRSKKAARTTALFVALAAMFSTWIIVYIMIGHNTKIMVLMTFPYIFLCLEKLIDRWSLLYAGLLVLAVHVLWEANHLQTAFYGACAVGFYLLFEIIAALVSRQNLLGVVRAAAVILAAAGITYGMGMDRGLAVSEYLPYSTRGAPAIKDMIAADSAGTGAAGEAADVGHGYEYATSWSFSPEEVVTFLIPGYFGWGKLRVGDNPEAELAGTYWGQMSFTDAGHYAGIAVLILAILGIWLNVRSRFVQAMLVIGLFGLILSFGKNWPYLYDLFYNLVPRFNTLRAPSQSLVLLEFVLPILAGFGIESILAMRRAGDNPKVDNSIKWGAVAFGVFFVIGLVGSSLFQEAYRGAVYGSPLRQEYDAALQQYPPESQGQVKNQIDAQFAAIYDTVYDTMVSDWIFSGLFGLATLLLLYFYLRGKTSPTIFKLLLFGILIFDLWRVGRRPMDAQPAEIVEQQHAATDVDQFLKQDTSIYRTMDMTTQPNYPAYHFHQHVLGYHSAKLRAYQDLLDIAGNTNQITAPLALNLLNTKYLVLGGKEAQQAVQRGNQPVFQSGSGRAVFLNGEALPRAWFVNRLEVAQPRQILEKIRDNGFDPRDVAYVDTLPSPAIEPVGYSKGTAAPADTAAPGDTTTADRTIGGTPGSPGNGTVTITRYEPLEIEMKVNAPGRNFLVLSEINYPPGWRATIDGQPATIHRTNYLLRGLVVPAGQHTITLTCVSTGLETGKWVSLGLNLLVFGMIGYGAMKERKRSEDADPRHEAPAIAEDDV